MNGATGPVGATQGAAGATGFLGISNLTGGPTGSTGIPLSAVGGGARR